MPERTSPPPLTDLSEICRRVHERRDMEAAELAEQEPPQQGSPVSRDFVLQCLGANELGDGMLYAEINRGQYLFNASEGFWLAWSGHFWQHDIAGKAFHAVEQVTAGYLNEYQSISRQKNAASEEEDLDGLGKQQKAIKRRLDRLRTVRGRKNVLEMAATCGGSSLTVTGEKLDADPMILACQNGVVDLRTGRHRDGQPEDLLTKAAGVDFPTDCGEYLITGQNSPCPTWDNFLLEIMDGNQAMVDYLGRLFGYGITGLTTENIFVILFGHGRNGKSVMIETLQKILGPLAGPIPSEMLLSQGRLRNSSGPSADIMSLQGLRLAFASETDSNCRFDTAGIKRMSGGDTLTGRNPHGKFQTSFAPAHLLCLATNFRPRANPDDRPFWLRMHFVDFPMSFVNNPVAANEKPVDKTLAARLVDEGPGILAWLVRGCLLWQKDGLSPPAEVLRATAEYRRAEDDLADWLEEKCLVAEESTVTAKEAYQSFKEWYIANISEKPISQKKFGDAMTRRFKKDRGGPSSTNRYLGLEIKRFSE